MQKLPDLLALVRQADAAIMDVYNAGTTVVNTKANNSPITQADTASHDILVNGLARLFPDTPVVSEEGDEAGNAKLVQQTRYWAVDPLDGTRDFISRTGDFTVCVGLIEDDEPVFGVVSAPARGVVYYGGPGMGAYKIEGDGSPQPIHVSAQKLQIVFASLSHPDQPTNDFITQHYGDYTVKNVGSQLKLLHIAEGLGDAYPRLNSPLHHWDLAAGHAILVAAGGGVTHPDGTPIDYHAQSLKAGDFIASAHAL